MKTFEEDLLQVIKNKIIADVGKTALVNLGYEQRKHLPSDFIDKVYASIDWDAVIQQVKPEIEKRICNTLVASLETELKTDVKSVLSVAGIRERLRMEVYPKLLNVLNNK